MSKNVKEVKEFNLGYNLPQVRSLEGDELFAEHDKLQQHFARKTNITYNSQNKPTVEQVLNDLKEVDEVRIDLGSYLKVRVGQNNRIWVNGNLVGYNAGSTKDEQVRADEVWTYVEKTNDWLSPTTVRDTGETWLRNKLTQLLE